MNDESSYKSKFVGFYLSKFESFIELFKGNSPLTRCIESRTILLIGWITDSTGYNFVGL